LLSDTGRLLHRNDAAREHFARVPDWLAACATSNGGPLPRWVRRVHIDPATVLVLADLGSVALDDAADAPWALRWQLPPRLARVAACLACGHTDKEIAARLGLGYQTVRTYVKQVYRRTRLRNRAELVRAVHTGWLRAEP
jgi:DNA-binding NarL/FixJ family response regulator